MDISSLQYSRPTIFINNNLHFIFNPQPKQKNVEKPLMCSHRAYFTISMICYCNLFGYSVNDMRDVIFRLLPPLSLSLFVSLSLSLSFSLSIFLFLSLSPTLFFYLTPVSYIELANEVRFLFKNKYFIIT